VAVDNSESVATGVLCVKLMVSTNLFTVQCRIYSFTRKNIFLTDNAK